MNRRCGQPCRLGLREAGAAPAQRWDGSPVPRPELCPFVSPVGLEEQHPLQGCCAISCCSPTKLLVIPRELR